MVSGTNGAEGLDGVVGGASIGGTFIGIEGNQVDLGFEGGQETTQGTGLIGTVIDSLQQDLFEGDALPGFEGVASAGVQDLLDRIDAAHRHDFLP